MRTLLITPFQNHTIGGVERVNQQLIEILQDLGSTVEFLTSEEKKGSIKEKLLSKFIGPISTTLFKYKDLEKKYDLIICNGEFGLGIYGEKVINIFHGSYKGYREAKNNYLNLKQKLSMSILESIQRKSSKGKFVVSVSESLKDILHRQGIKVDRVIQNGVDTNHFKPIQGERKGLLFVGKYDYYGKGIDILEKIKEDGSSVSILSTSNIVEKTNLTLIVPTDYKSLPEIYNKYRMLIFPSRFESAGLAVLEAMSCGLPIIMNNTGYANEIAAEIPEFVMEKDSDHTEYMKRIQVIESNYQEYSKKARQLCLQQFDLDKFKINWTKVFEEFNA